MLEKKWNLANCLYVPFAWIKKIYNVYSVTHLLFCQNCPVIIVASNKPKQTNKQYISSICKFGRKIKTGLNNVQAKKNTKQNASNYLNLKKTKNKATIYYTNNFHPKPL